MKAMVIVVLLLLAPTITYCDEKDMTEPLKAAKAKHQSAIMALPDVVSMGIGRNADGDAAIIVGLEKSNPKTEARIRRILDGHPTQIRIVGRIQTQTQ